MNTDSANIPILPSITVLAGEADVWLTDIWGVMHNGVAPYEGAVEACRNFRAQGGTVILLSNSPRPNDGVATQLDSIGVPRDAWDAIVSSGDTSRSLIAELGPVPIHHIGPERDLPLFDDLRVALAPPERAVAIVCSGLFDDATETPDDYRAQLANLYEHGLRMICANPDLKVERGDKIIYCAGALAAEYEKLGGQVTYAGKPHQPIYDRARDVIAELRGAVVENDRILAIGDGVLTDIKGASLSGIRSVFVASAIHTSNPNDLDASELQSIFSETGFAPDAAMTGLRW